MILTSNSAAHLQQHVCSGGCANPITLSLLKDCVFA